MEQFALSFELPRQTYTVSELNGRIRQKLDEEFGLIWVSGEISGTRLASSGHYYFTLKDTHSQIKCACFRMSARYLKFKPQDGVLVIARGRVDVYEARGEYQLLVESLEPQGHGALQFAFEQLKKKLSMEGLFEQARKRALPKLPRRIGIVTSPSGAVIQDMLQVLARRFPGLHIQLYPAPVQGEGSVEQVTRGLTHFSESGWAEVVIIARGGGSLEDLWTFNEEVVARAIAACSVPVISAVGHETDFTIADFVADLRAPTPSAAAEMVICTREQLLENIESCRRVLTQRMHYRIGVAARALHERGTDRASTILHRSIGRSLQKTDDLSRCSLEAVRKRFREAEQQWVDLDRRLQRMDLRLRFADARRKLDALQTEVQRLMLQRITGNRGELESADQRLRSVDLRLRFAEAQHRLEVMRNQTIRLVTLQLTNGQSRYRPISAQLSQLSPLKVLERGYAIVQTVEGKLVKSPGDVALGAELTVRLAEGEISVKRER